MEIRMKRLALITALVIGAAAMMAGCAPSEDSTVLQVNPDFQTKDNIKLDFTQLHNDAIEGIQSVEDGEPYVFISDLDITGDADSKTVTIRAVAVDGTSEADCQSFASILLCQINDAAAQQDARYELSSADSFGSFYNEYAIDLAVSDADGGFIYSLSVPAGDEIPLDPDYESYVEEWKKELEIYKDNLVYDINGNVVRNGNE